MQFAALWAKNDNVPFDQSWWIFFFPPFFSETQGENVTSNSMGIYCPSSDVWPCLYLISFVFFHHHYSLWFHGRPLQEKRSVYLNWHWKTKVRKSNPVREASTVSNNVVGKRSKNYTVNRNCFGTLEKNDIIGLELRHSIIVLLLAWAYPTTSEHQSNIGLIDTCAKSWVHTHTHGIIGIGSDRI